MMIGVEVCCCELQGDRLGLQESSCALQDSTRSLQETAGVLVGFLQELYMQHCLQESGTTQGFCSLQEAACCA
jgi:hypothetical protein